jgi:hypothetical protein
MDVARPQRICVAASDCQSEPALDIFEPGKAWGMPYAPELGLLAYTFQPLSRFHSESRHENWLDDQPYDPSMPMAICCAEPDGAGAAWLDCDG